MTGGGCSCLGEVDEAAVEIEVDASVKPENEPLVRWILVVVGRWCESSIRFWQAPFEL